jgi:TnpA family transposase
MLRKLGSYPRQNGLAIALREFGCIERTLFILVWLQNVELRRRAHAGVNQGEARNALANAVFIHRLASSGTGPSNSSVTAPAIDPGNGRHSVVEYGRS